MAVLSILKKGNPILRRKSKPIKKITRDILKLVEEMEETMYVAHGVGLAAPQIGVNKRLIVMDVQDGAGLRALVNPELFDAEGEELGLEGCLSVPGYEGLVKRAATIKVRWMGLEGEEKEMACEGLLARAVQHEVDHLDGILYIDKVVGELRPLDETLSTGRAI